MLLSAAQQGQGQGQGQGAAPGPGPAEETTAPSPSPSPDPAEETTDPSPSPSPGGCSTAVQAVLQYQCAAGSECLATPPRCDRQDECDPCPAGFVSVEGEPCEACADAGPGKVANTDQTVCIACSPGKEPLADRSGCMDCAGAAVSTYGIECVQCPILAVANAERTICQACPAGKGPNGDNTDCDACGSGQYSTVGMCQDCAAPRVVNAPACATSNGTACALNADATACDVSAGDADCMYTAGRTQCSTCQAGTGPTADATGCEPCRGNKVSTQGQCVECAAGRIANDNRVACDDMGNTPLNDVSTALEVLASTNFEPITSLELEIDDADVLMPGPAQEAYLDALKADLAASLNVSVDLIQIANFGATNAGRRRLQAQPVTFDLILAGPSATESLMELSSQLGDPSSRLMSSSVGSTINSDVPPVFSFACPTGLHRPLDGADGQCVACPNPESQVPDRLADFRSCRECLPGQVPDAESGSRCVCAQGYYNASKSSIRCYASGQDWKPDDIQPDVECVPCAETGCLQGYDPSNGVFGQITCHRGKVELNPGYSVSVASKSESVPFDQIRNPQRGVFPCASDACIVENGRPACVQGHTGPLCANCAAGYSRPGFVGRCKECSQTMSAMWAIFGAMSALALIITGLYFVSVDSTSGKIASIVTLGKIAISLVQVLTSLQFTLRVQWPTVFLWFVNLLKVFSFDLLGFVDVGCVSSYTYYTKVLFAAFMPPVLLAGVAVVYKLRQEQEGIGNRCVRMALSVVFLVYPFISTTVFQGFSCRETDDGESWLDVDHQIDCNSPEYLLEFWTFGVLGMFVYPIGIPTLTMLLLFKNSKSIKASLANGEASPAAERYSFLVADYRANFYYWCVLLSLSFFGCLWLTSELHIDDLSAAGIAWRC